MEIQIRLCENLKYYRKKSGWTEKEIAEKLDISQQAYSNYECGTRTPDAELIVKIAALFQTTADDLMSGDHSLSVDPKALFLREESGYPDGKKAPLSKEEERLLALFRPLSPTLKKELLSYLDFRCQNNT